MGYVVTAKRDGKKIYSHVYKTKPEAEKHVMNTKKNWGKSYKNPRVKKV